MDRVVYLGDEVGAAGWRLAGVVAALCGPADATAALRQACDTAALVLVSAAAAQGIDPDVLRRAMAAASPLVLVVPDALGRAPLPDLAPRLRAQLGMPPAQEVP